MSVRRKRICFVVNVLTVFIFSNSAGEGKIAKRKERKEEEEGGNHEGKKEEKRKKKMDRKEEEGLERER